MTDSEDRSSSEDHSSTRPISVAELLARNGSIGAPPVGGRRRRRRGNTDSVTVAELTGEIPIITDSTPEPKRATNGTAAHVDEVEPVVEPVTPPVVDEQEPVVDEVAADTADTDTADTDTADTDTADTDTADTETDRADEVHAADKDEAVDSAAAVEDTAGEGGVLDAVLDGVVDDAPDEVAEPAPDAAAEAEYAAFLAQRDAADAPVEFAAPPRRPQVATPPAFSAPAGGAETMSPDPLGDDADIDDGPEVDLVQSLEFETETDDESTAAAFDVPSYLRSNSDTLFGGGQSLADDLARRGAAPVPEDIDLGEDRRLGGEEVDAEQRTGSAFLRGVWVVVQCVLAVAFGAGLFIAFDLLWKWNTIVALVLAVLVILGLVAGVRVVRKSEDIASTLIAVAVGALVAFGPLALLQSH